MIAGSFWNLGFGVLEVRGRKDRKGKVPISFCIAELGARLEGKRSSCQESCQSENDSQSCPRGAHLISMGSLISVLARSSQGLETFLDFPFELLYSFFFLTQKPLKSGFFFFNALPEGHLREAGSNWALLCHSFYTPISAMSCGSCSPGTAIAAWVVANWAVFLVPRLGL